MVSVVFEIMKFVTDDFLYFCKELIDVVFSKIFVCSNLFSRNKTVFAFASFLEQNSLKMTMPGTPCHAQL